MSSGHQLDPSKNLVDVSGSILIPWGQNFAFPATSTLVVSQGFSTIHRLPETQINIFDVKDSVEIQLLTSVFNHKIGISKTGSAATGFTLDTSTNAFYNSSTDVLIAFSICCPLSTLKAFIK